MDKIKIVIVDDHQMFRDGLKHLLSNIENTELVGEASNGKDFLNLLDLVTPDIVLMDINMPVMDGMEATRQAKIKMPDLKILVLSMYSEEQYYRSMSEVGVNGFILKQSGYDELERAIQSVMKGSCYFSQELLMNLLHKKTDVSHIHLSDREQEVLSLICKGYSNNEIADKLFLSIRTIEKYRSDLLLRTHSPNSISLVIYAIKNNLVTI
jgi:DNA-binding NarL/FixJ family response regulator